MKKVYCLKAVILLSLVSFCAAIFLIPSFSLAEEQEPSPNSWTDHLGVFKSDGTTPAVEYVDDQTPYDYKYSIIDEGSGTLDINSNNLVIKGDGTALDIGINVSSDTNVINEISFEDVNFEAYSYQEAALKIDVSSDNFILNLSKNCIFKTDKQNTCAIKIAGGSVSKSNLYIKDIGDNSVLTSSNIYVDGKTDLYFKSNLSCILGGDPCYWTPIYTQENCYFQDNTIINISVGESGINAAINCHSIYFEDNSSLSLLNNTASCIMSESDSDPSDAVVEFNTNGNIILNSIGRTAIMAEHCNINKVGKLECKVTQGRSGYNPAFLIFYSLNINCGNVYLSGCQDNPRVWGTIAYDKDATIYFGENIHMFGSDEINDFVGSTKNVIFKLADDSYYTCYIDDDSITNDDSKLAKSVVFVKEEPPGPGPTPGPTPDPSSDVSGTGSAQTGDFTPMSTLLLLALLALPSLFMLRRKLNNRIN